MKTNGVAPAKPKEGCIHLSDEDLSQKSREMTTKEK